jgi:hypothetical protein
MRRISLVALLALGWAAGCGGTALPVNGQQACAPAGASRRCPEGFMCSPVDNRCWRNGTGPGDGGGADGGADGAVPDGGGALRDAAPFEATPSRPLPSGYRMVPGGQTSASETYRAVRSLPPPPGSKVMQSDRYRMVGGLLGATQK